MLLYEHSKPTQYPVELSGWDPANSFFTEHATLAWSETSGIVLYARRELNPVSTVYVRLLSVHGTKGPALPYRIAKLERTPDCYWSVSLFPFEEDDGESAPSDRQNGGHDQLSLLGQPVPLSKVCREHILRVLNHCGGNRSRAAQILGIGRTSLYRFLLGEREEPSAN